MAQHFGFKKCDSNRIVKLEILGENNEERKDIVDKFYAKHRCSKAKVIDIYDMFNKNIKYDEAFGIYNMKFSYKKGNIVEPDSYDSDINEVCSNGIHYFISEEPAYFYDHISEYGFNKSWLENGQKIDCTYEEEFDSTYLKMEMEKNCYDLEYHHKSNIS